MGEVKKRAETSMHFLKFIRKKFSCLLFFMFAVKGDVMPSFLLFYIYFTFLGVKLIPPEKTTFKKVY